MFDDRNSPVDLRRRVLSRLRFAPCLDMKATWNDMHTRLTCDGACSTCNTNDRVRMTYFIRLWQLTGGSYVQRLDMPDPYYRAWVRLQARTPHSNADLKHMAHVLQLEGH